MIKDFQSETSSSGLTPSKEPKTISNQAEGILEGGLSIASEEFKVLEKPLPFMHLGGGQFKGEERKHKLSMQENNLKPLNHSN